MSNNFDYKKVLMNDDLLRINDLINAVNDFYSENKSYYNPCHSIFNDSVYSLELKNTLGQKPSFGYLCSIGSNKMMNVNNKEIFNIENGIVKLPNALYISMSNVIFQNKALNDMQSSEFKIYFELLSKIENAINKKILSFTNFEFLNKDSKISVQLKIKIFISDLVTGFCDYQYIDIIEINNLYSNNEKYWKRICFNAFPHVFNGIEQNEVINSSTESLINHLKLLNY